MAKKKPARASAKSPAPEPPADRPSFAKGYGIKKDTDGMVPWNDVCARLEKSLNYWVATTRPDGRPHVMPVWGVWYGGAVIFGTDRNSRKGRNLQANPHATVHLESGDDVVILECTPREVTDKNEIAAIDALYKKKYKMKLTGAPGELYIVAMNPRVAFAWHERDFPKSATRWKF
jgi:pyridoxine/pyridoxamine 5'-phosphate oxidase